VSTDAQKLDEALSKLREISRLLHHTSLTILIITLSHLLFPIALVFALAFVAYTASVHLTPSLAISLGLPLMLILSDFTILISVIIYLYKNDRLQAQGNALYHEISDELEWHVKKTTTQTVAQPDAQRETNRNPNRDAPGLNVRLALREFVQESRLPFFPEGGLSYYLGLNILLTLFAVAFVVIIGLK
jgi:hypothetical protein